MNCTDVEGAQKYINPAHPAQTATATGPRDSAKEASSPVGSSQNAVSIGGSPSHLNALDTKYAPAERPGAAGATLNIPALSLRRQGGGPGFNPPGADH